MKKIKNGFTLIELLIGLTLGILVLTALVSFFFRTSKLVENEQKMVKDLSQLQFVMNKIVQDIKNANTQAPAVKQYNTGTSTYDGIDAIDWAKLPYMPYGRPFAVSIYQPPATTYPKDIPTYPLAYNFPVFQSGKTSTEDGWYPEEDPAYMEKESNELAFYKIEGNNIVRILYYLDEDPAYPNPPKVYRLKRKKQFITITALKNIADPNPFPNDYLPNPGMTEDIVLTNLKLVQFTYPLLTTKMAKSGDANYNADLVDTALISRVENIMATEPDVIMKERRISLELIPFRNIINIKLVTAGPQIGNERAKALELSTEVNIRN